jgi:AcrR family transcriptional regulator
MPKPSDQKTRRNPRGRPREFDEAAVLDAAITLFRRRSYSGVSISDLTDATGLTAGSIYKAFKDKQGLFAQALARYIDQREIRLREKLDRAKDGKSRIAALLGDYIALSQGRDGELGCMVVAGIIDLEQLDDVSAHIGDQLARRRAALEALILEGCRDGSIREDIDAGASADVILALLQGMRVVAKASTLTDDEEAFLHCALKLLD